MKYLSANGKEFNIKVTFYLSNRYYRIVALDCGEEMGYLTFNIKNGNAWLYKIATNEKYQHQGVGKALLDTFEYVLINKRIFSIDGKFYPDNQYAKPFYEKNGYSIIKDDYETYVGKYLEGTKIQEELQGRIVDFEIQEEKSEELSRE